MEIGNTYVDAVDGTDGIACSQDRNEAPVGFEAVEW
jgi:hypothetical protein